MQHEHASRDGKSQVIHYKRERTETSRLPGCIQLQSLTFKNDWLSHSDDGCVKSLFWALISWWQIKYEFCSSYFIITPKYFVAQLHFCFVSFSFLIICVVVGKKKKKTGYDAVALSAFSKDNLWGKVDLKTSKGISWSFCICSQ